MSSVAFSYYIEEAEGVSVSIHDTTRLSSLFHVFVILEAFKLL